MPGARTLAAWLSVATLAAISTCAPMAAGQSSAQPVAIGDLGALAHARGARGALRRALTAELTTLGGVRVAPASGARWVLRGSVTRLDRRDLGHGVEVQCAVSLVLSDARGNVRAMLSGRAGARGGGEAGQVERAAMQAAVRGALRPLPQALRRGL